MRRPDPGQARVAERAVTYVATIGARREIVQVTGTGGRYRLRIGDEAWEVDARATGPGTYSLLVGGLSYVAEVVHRDGACVVDVGGETHTIEVEEATRWTIRTRGGTTGASRGQTLTAPLPGKITHVAVRPGDRVAAGDTLVVIEAMKMENEFKASAAGTVAEVRVQAGEAVNPGDVLVVVE
jgi:biotin carboxyl carrier protein